MRSHHPITPALYRVPQVPRDKTSAQIDLPLPLTCANIMIEFAEFHADPARADDPASTGAGGASGGAGRRGHSAGGELHCPRCGRPVNDIHGVCRQCGEVAFQCCQVGLVVVVVGVGDGVIVVAAVVAVVAVAVVLVLVAVLVLMVGAGWGGVVIYCRW